MTDPRPLVLDPAKLAAAKAQALGTTARAPKRAPVAAVPFDRVCAAYGLPVPTPEYRFCDRKWRLDHAWPEYRVALEVEGWGHRTKERYTKDIEKYNRLAELGWRLVRCTPRTRDTSATLDAIAQALAHQP